jgi:SAM-dependent methyltransferase
VNGADFSQIRLAAATHPHAYAFHKYWARKPHNVVRHALAVAGVGPGALVLDPFCGSGVPLSEAAELGARALGCDVNPVAVELTRVTLDPPDAGAVERAVGSLLAELEREFGTSYGSGGKSLRYAVHATVVACSACGALVSADHAEKRGRSHICPRCHGRLYYNLENLVATRSLRSVLADGSSHDGGDERPLEPETLTGCDHELVQNTRILAFRGMRTRQLFTPRNFALLSAFARRIESLPPELRPAARLTLTASVAQCSRLVAARNGLTTGGPAWTVPGFWVPPIHVETNPLPHLRARLKRLARGLAGLARLGNRGSNHRIEQADAGTLLAGDVPASERADLAFLDPPYGDSVPYLEFSALWNAFLGPLPDPGLDIAVSNRARGDATWERYAAALASIVALVRRRLKDDGRVVATFNNKDPRAWRAFSSALEGAGLHCIGAFHQAPAVISAKAQLAPEGSYIGDYYGLYAIADAC